MWYLLCGLLGIITGIGLGYLSYLWMLYRMWRES